MTRSACFSRLLLGVGTATLIAPLPMKAVQAQDKNQFALEEVVVTARRREENLMDVPMAITAVTSQQIEAAGIKDLNTLAQYTPGLFSQTGVNNRVNRQLTFRGLSVATGQVFVDGAPYAGNGTPNLGNLERVEVLVGPQSVYFGRSTFTGAVNFVTKDPSPTFQGQVRAEYAKFGTTDDQLILEGPLVSEKLGIRVAARHYSTDGQYVNQGNTSDTMGAQSTNSLTATLVYTASDNFKAKVLLDYIVDDDGTPPSIALKGDKQLFCQLGGTQGAYACGKLPAVKDIDPTIVSGNSIVGGPLYNLLINNTQGYPLLFPTSYMTHFGQKTETYMGHLNLGYTTPSGWELTSGNAFHKTKSQTIFSPLYVNAQNLANPAFGLRLPNGALQFPQAQPDRCVCLLTQNLFYDSSLELRLTSPQEQRLRGTVGANYLYTRSPGQTAYGILQVGPTFSGSQTRVVSSTPAVFGGIYYDILPALTLSAEARYQWDKISATAKYPNSGEKLQDTFRSFSPRVTLDYKYSEDSLVYALWSRGYRPGGFNAVIVGQPASVLAQLAANNARTSYEQEKLDNVEFGIKSTWLDGRVRTRLGVYNEQWSKGQVPNVLFYQNPNLTISQITLVTNIGAVRLRGVEAEGDFAVTENLTVSATLYHQDSRIKSYVYIPAGPEIRGSSDVTGNRFQQAPDWSWTLSPTYTGHLGGIWDWYGRLDYRHRGKYMIDPTNVTWIGATEIVDIRMGVRSDHHSLEFFVTNLTDNSNFTNGAKGSDSLSNIIRPNKNEIRLALPDRRVFGVKAAYNF